MKTLAIILIALVLLLLLGVILALRIVKQYEQGVLIRFGKLIGTREPGLRLRGVSTAANTSWSSSRISIDPKGSVTPRHGSSLRS